MTTESTQLAERFASLFRSDAPFHGRCAMVGIKANGKVDAKCWSVQQPANLELYRSHLDGEGPGLGLSPVQSDGTVWFAAIDFDDRSVDHVRLEARIEEQRLPLVVCRSKSGGAHLYLFMREAAPASAVRRVLRACLPLLGLPDETEIFPKQDRLSESGKANWINLPYYGSGDRLALRDGAWISLEAFLSLAESRRVPAQYVNERASGGGKVSEGNRNVALNKYLFVARKQGASDEELEALAEEFNAERLDPPLDASEVYGVVRSVRGVEIGQQAVSSGRVSEADVLEYMNDRFAVCLIGGKMKVLRFEPDGSHEVLSRDGFLHYFENKTLWFGERPVNQAKWWLLQPGRRQYSGIVFEPGVEDTGSAFNLFRGWAVQAREGDIGPFLHHVHHNIAAGNGEHTSWILSWMADIVRHPRDKKGSALVLVGSQGTGKTLVGKVLGAILGRHYELASHESHVTGRFNSHHEGLLLLHSDEALFAGDHAATGKLKDFVTSDYQLVERKGVDVVRLRNYARLLVTSEQQWVVPASLQERRFAVFQMATQHMQDKDYFGALVTWLQHGGYEALLYFFLHLEYDPALLRSIPKTGALGEQKMLTMSPEELWWLDILTAGVLPGDETGSGACPASALYDHYLRRAAMRGVRRKQAETHLGYFFRRIFGEHSTRKQVLDSSGQRIVMREFSDLKTSRSLFSAAMKRIESWDEPHDWMPDPAASHTEMHDAF